MKNITAEQYNATIQQWEATEDRIAYNSLNMRILAMYSVENNLGSSIKNNKFHRRIEGFRHEPEGHKFYK